MSEPTQEDQERAPDFYAAVTARGSVNQHGFVMALAGFAADAREDGASEPLRIEHIKLNDMRAERDAARAEVERLKAELKPFQPMTVAEAEAEIAAFDATEATAPPLSDERIKEMVRYATTTDLERAGMTAERYRRAYRAECTLREAVQAERDAARAERDRLRSACEAVDAQLDYLQNLWGKEAITDGLVKQLIQALASPAPASKGESEAEELRKRLAECERERDKVEHNLGQLLSEVRAAVNELDFDAIAQMIGLCRGTAMISCFCGRHLSLAIASTAPANETAAGGGEGSDATA